MTQLCKPKKKEGRWLTAYDIVETPVDGGIALSLERQASFGKCATECHTIRKSCSNMLDKELDTDELVAAVWKVSRGKTELSKVVERFCVKETGRCRKGKGAKPLEPGSRTDEAFSPRSLKSIEAAELAQRVNEDGSVTIDNMVFEGGDEPITIGGRPSDDF